MNFSEFKKILGAEPRNRDPEFLRARDSDSAFRAAAAEAAEFEDRLEEAFQIEAPRDLLDRIARIPAGSTPETGPVSHRPWRWVAAAAVVVAGIAVASIAWYESTFQWESVNDYIVDHWRVDGAEFLGQADGQPVDPATVADLFEDYGMAVSPALAGRIDILGHCKTPGARGAHMIISTDQGPVTLIFMPEVETANGHILAFDHMVAATLQLERGSAVLIGPNEEVLAPVYALARQGIRPASSTT